MLTQSPLLIAAVVLSLTVLLALGWLYQFGERRMHARRTAELRVEMSARQAQQMADRQRINTILEEDGSTEPAYRPSAAE